MTTADVRQAARRVLETANPAEKTGAARSVAADWRAGRLRLPDPGADGVAPDRPARPVRPRLVAPGQVPRRRLTTKAGRFALLHAVAHIEFNAIDLAFDLIARFGGDPRIVADDRAAFVGDWAGVGDDEARHFELVRGRLRALGGDYGDLPAHDGLWAAALNTRDDLAARLAVAPMVLEARGLDVTPGMIERLTSAGDDESAAVLEVIYNDEIGHVAAGARWFERVCAAEDADPETRFRELVTARFNGELKPPFNIEARGRAGLPRRMYQPLAGGSGSNA